MSDKVLNAARRRLAEYMLREGKRNTRQRDVIVEVFFTEGMDKHVSLQELLELTQVEEPGVGFATVYRTMKMLLEAGVAHERRFGEGQTRYEVAHTGEHHDHMICVDCGRIFEFEDPVIEERQRQAAERIGLRITHHRHEVYGSCMQGEGCPHRGSGTPDR